MPFYSPLQLWMSLRQVFPRDEHKNGSNFLVVVVGGFAICHSVTDGE